MTTLMISKSIKNKLLQFLEIQKAPDLVSAYLFFLEKNCKVSPVILTIEKKIYKNSDDALAAAEKNNLIWKETEIKIGFIPPSVNIETKKVYICPFSGKAFGDNTHPNPQDAIYDWVAKTPENKERIGGVKAKRFYISEDPEVISQYIKPLKAPITKTVYSSVISGKLFNSKESTRQDFKEHYLKPISLVDVQNQNRYEIQQALLTFLENELQEDKMGAFVEALSDFSEFESYVGQWVEEEEE